MALIPSTLDAMTSVISVADPAIDTTNSEKKVIDGVAGNKPVLSYIQDRFTEPSSWRETVKFKDGQSPTVFTIGVIAPSMLNLIDDECQGRSSQRHWRSFLNGIREIEAGPTVSVMKDGRTVQVTPKIEINGIEYVDPQWLSTTFVRGLRHIAIEIGMVCYNWNSLTESDIKN